MDWSEKSETARRIAAARILQGWDQGELNRRLEEAQVGSDMGWRLENDDTPFPKPRRDAVAGVLGVSEEWFTAPVETLLGTEIPKPVLAARLAQLEEQVKLGVERREEILREILEAEIRRLTRFGEAPTSDEKPDPTQNDEEDGLPPAQEQR